MEESKTIEIKCTTQDHLNLAEMTELQGTLKERTDIDYDKIKLSIIKYGFSFPMFIWRDKKDKKNYLCDGHGRFATLCKMQKDGYEIPGLPVVYIECKDKKEAKQKLLRLNSQYGKMTKESVLEFASGLDLNFEELALPGGAIDFTDSVVSDDEVTDETNTSESNFNYQNQYGVIVICQSESEQERVFNKLNNEGYSCKVVCV